MINKLRRPGRRLRQAMLAIEARTWTFWHMIAVPAPLSGPPEHLGATEGWSPKEAFAATELPDWDDVARAQTEDAEFWAEWNAEMDAIERYVQEKAHAIEVLARAFLTGGHTTDNLPVVVALTAS